MLHVLAEFLRLVLLNVHHVADFPRQQQYGVEHAHRHGFAGSGNAHDTLMHVFHNRLVGYTLDFGKEFHGKSLATGSRTQDRLHGTAAHRRCRNMPADGVGHLFGFRSAADDIKVFAREGKRGFLKEREAEITAFLKAGLAVCLPDLRGMGETRDGMAMAKEDDVGVVVYGDGGGGEGCSAASITELTNG